MPFQKRIFQKPSLNLQQQIDLLQKKGLDISNPDRILHYLCFIGYYRLSGYFQPFQNYHKPDLPPSWMIAEVLSIGTWSNIFHNLQSRELQKQISKPYGLHYTVMASWLHSFTYLRNLCAHHSRLWNRIFIIKPKALKKHQKHFANNSRFSSQAAILNVFLSVIADGSHWQQRLRDLLMESQAIPIKQMGFCADWDSDSFWCMNH